MQTTPANAPSWSRSCNIRRPRQGSRPLLLAGLLIGAAAAAPARAHIFDTFNRPDGAAIGNGWIEKNPAAFTLVAGEAVKQAVATGYRDNVVYRPGAEDVQDVEASVEFRLTAVPPGFPQILVRLQGATVGTADTLDGYLLFVNDLTTQAILARQTGSGSPTALATIAFAALNQTDRYRMRLRATGTDPVQLQAFVERALAGGAWQILGQTTFNDAAAERVTGAGSVGFGGFTEAAYVYDNFNRVDLGAVGSPNPPPTALSLSPSQANVGTPGLTLSVFGTGFTTDSVVRWNGANRTTTYITPTRLDAAITAADLAAVASVPVTVFNAAPGGGTSGALTFQVVVPTNPLPATTGLSPASATAGTPGFNLVVFGTSFIASSEVRWNGALRTTTFVSDTQLRAAIPAADIASAGTASVTVFTPAPGGGTSNAQTFTINAAGGNNPAPFLRALNPLTAAPGGGAFQLTLEGEGFVPGSTVRWNGAARTTTYISGAELRASIPAADIATEALAALSVENAGPGGGTSLPLTFFVQAGSVGVLFDGFNRPDSADPGNGWTEKNPDSFQVAGNELGSSTTVLGFPQDHMYRPAGEDRADLETSVEFRRLANVPGLEFANFPQVHARVRRSTIQDFYTMSSYIFFIDDTVPGPRAMFAVNDSPVAGIRYECYIAPVPLPAFLVEGNRYRLRLRVSGTAPVLLEGLVEEYAGGAWTTLAGGSATHAGTPPPLPGLFCDGPNLPPPVTEAGATALGKWTNRTDVYDNFFWRELPAVAPPAITSTVPAAFAVGAPTSELRVLGTGFTPDAVVLWNGTARTTTYVSAGEVRATIPAADLAAVGSAEVRVVRPGTGAVSNPATVQIVVPQADLAMVKTDGQATEVPGTPVSYTLTVTNNGPTTVTSVTVTDAVPAAILSPVFTPGTGAYDSGTGAWTGLSLATGQSAVLTLAGTVSPTATGTLANTASVAPPAGVADPQLGNNSSTDTNTLTPEADLAIVKTDGQATAVPGAPISYTITVTNNGPSTMTSLTVSDAVPPIILNPVFTPSTGSYNSGTGAWTGLSLATGQSIVLTLAGTVSPTATGNLVNTATVAPPAGATDPVAGNNSSTDTDTLTPQADLAIAKTDGQATAVPGAPISYTITVTNNGPSTVTSLTVTDPVPAAITGATFTPSTGSYDSGTGAWTGLNLGAGQSVTLTLAGTISPTATGTLVNTASVTAPAGVTDPQAGNNAASDTDTLTPQADLAIVKTNGQSEEVPGTPISYTITVTHNGASTISGLTVSDTVPAAILNPVFTPSTGSYNPATGAWTGVTLATGQSVTLTLTGTSSPDATGTLANTATVAPPAGVTDPVGANNSATDTDTLTPQADLAVVKTDGQASVVPSAPISYTITVTNNGPSTLTSLTLSDPVPAAILGPTFTPSTGSFNPATGAWTGLDLGLGETIVLTLNGTVDPAATGTLANTATVAPPAGATDPVPGNNSSTDTDVLTPRADLAIVKTDGQDSAIPGTPISYTITVTNLGPSTLASLTVTDPVPGVILSPVFTPSAGSYDSGTGAWTGLSLASGQFVTLTLSGTISPLATGTLSNTATVAPPAGATDPVPGNNISSDIDTLTPQAELAVVKTDGQASAIPGTPISYTITVTNNGPSTVTSLTLTDTVPAAILNAVFTPSAGSYNSGTGAWTGLSLATGQSVTLTLAGTVSPTATGTLANTATVAPPAGVTDPQAGNNSSTDTDTLTPQADLAVVKTDGQASAIPGTPISYTITVTNNGPSTVTSLTLTDTVPAAILSPVFTPSAGSYNSGTGAWTGLSLATGQSVTLTLAGTVNPTVTGSLANTATVAPPAGVTDPVAGNDSSTDTDALTPQADLGVVKTDGQTSAIPGTPISYTMTVTNNGPSTVPSLTLTDAVPAAILSPVFTPSAGSYNSGTGAWTGLNLATGQAVTLTLAGTVSPTATGTLANTATVTPPAGVTDPVAGNDSSTDTDALTPRADLGVVKTDAQTTAVPGLPIAYVITVTNNGPSTVGALTLTDAVPAAILNPVFTPSTGSYNSVTGAWTGLNLATGQNITLALAGTVSPSATGTLVNTATVAPPAGVTDSVPGNDSSTDTDTLTPEADLGVTLTDSPDPVTGVQTLTYTIAVTNAGPSAPSVVVTQTLPGSVTFLSASGTGWSCGEAGGVVTCTRPSLATGAAPAITVQVTAPPVGPTLTSTVTVSSGATDPVPANNSDTEQTTVTAVPVADLSVTLDDGGVTALWNRTLRYTILVRNLGPDPVTGATVTDAFPASLSGLAWTCAASAGSSCTAAGTGSINDAAVNLLTSGTATYTATGLVVYGTAGPITDTASASSTVYDPNTANNSATINTPVDPDRIFGDGFGSGGGSSPEEEGSPSA